MSPSKFLCNGARIEALCDATWSATENGADLLFYTTDSNAAQSEKMRILAGPPYSDQIDNFGLYG